VDRAASRAIWIFGPLMLPDLSSTSTTAVGLTGGCAWTGSIFSKRRLGLLRKLGIAVPGDEDQPSAGINVSFDGLIFVRGKFVIGIIVQHDRIPITAGMNHWNSVCQFDIDFGALERLKKRRGGLFAARNVEHVGTAYRPRPAKRVTCSPVAPRDVHFHKADSIFVGSAPRRSQHCCPV